MLSLASLVTNLIEAEPVVIINKRGKPTFSTSSSLKDKYKNGEITKEEYGRLRAKEYWNATKDKQNEAKKRSRAKKRLEKIMKEGE